MTHHGRATEKKPKPIKSDGFVIVDVTKDLIERKVLQPDTQARVYEMNGCIIMVENSTPLGLHMIIQHAKRTPEWREVRAARYALIKGDVSMGLILPSDEQMGDTVWKTIHLWEIKLTKAEAPRVDSPQIEQVGP